jgi:cell shape-determining protein MreC
MHGLRFNHVYGLLLLFCAASAFVLPKFVDPARAQLQNVYAPVSRPALAMAQWIHGWFDRTRVPDAISPEAPRSDADIRRENLELHQTLAFLTREVETLQERVAERAKLGSLAELCTSYSVSAGDSGSSESLVIGGGDFAGLKAGMPAVYPGGLAGQLQTPGLMGTRVRLITDSGFSIIGTVVRFVRRTDGRTEPVSIPIGQVLVTGLGKNGLVIKDMPLEKAQQIHDDDWVEVDDSDKWLSAVQGEFIGRVVKIVPASSRHASMFEDIQLEPAARLMQLRELMVVDKAK